MCIGTSKKKPSVAITEGFWNKCLAMTYSHMGPPTLPSALSRFTTEFEKGSGGTNSLWSSGKLATLSSNSLTGYWRLMHQHGLFKKANKWLTSTPNWPSRSNFLRHILWILGSFLVSRPGIHSSYMIKPHEQLVLVSSTPHNAYTSRLSTS